MACKSYGEKGSESDLRSALIEAFHTHQTAGQGAVKIKDLLGGSLRTRAGITDSVCDFFR
jgi:hypothetical protein